MKKTFLILLMTFSLTGCATLTTTVKGWIPSFWDDNQSASIINTRLAVDRLDCAKPHLPQVVYIRDQLRWFELYSQSKGWQQADVLRVIGPMQSSVDDFYKRSVDEQGSNVYCEIKKKLLATQAETAAKAILGRF